MDDVDMLTLVIQEMSKEFPTLMETLVHERDQLVFIPVSVLELLFAALSFTECWQLKMFWFRLNVYFDSSIFVFWVCFKFFNWIFFASVCVGASV